MRPILTCAYLGIDLAWVNALRLEEMERLLAKANSPTHLLLRQDERIKNTPLPRQYAFFSTLFVWIFNCLLPFALVGEFVEFGQQQGHAWMIWLTVPFSVLLSGVFLTMEMIGHYSENPFEGGLNEAPMTALSRTIEIDLNDPRSDPGAEAIDDILIRSLTEPRS